MDEITTLLEEERQEVEEEVVVVVGTIEATAMVEGEEVMVITIVTTVATTVPIIRNQHELGSKIRRLAIRE